MITRAALACVLLLGCGGSSPSAADPRATSGAEHGADEGLTADQVVEITVNDPPPLAPGERGSLRVTLSIARGYHVMSNPPSKPNYVPTTVRLEAPSIRFGTPVFPAFTPFTLWDAVIDTLQGDAIISVPFEVSGDATPALVRGSCSVEYQACSEGSCLFPFSKAVDFTVRVAEPAPALSLARGVR